MFDYTNFNPDMIQTPQLRRDLKNALTDPNCEIEHAAYDKIIPAANRFVKSLSNYDYEDSHPDMSFGFVEGSLNEDDQVDERQKSILKRAMKAVQKSHKSIWIKRKLWKANIVPLRRKKIEKICKLGGLIAGAAAGGDVVGMGFVGGKVGEHVVGKAVGAIKQEVDAGQPNLNPEKIEALEEGLNLWKKDIDGIEKYCVKMHSHIHDAATHLGKIASDYAPMGPAAINHCEDADYLLAHVYKYLHHMSKSYVYMRYVQLLCKYFESLFDEYNQESAPVIKELLKVVSQNLGSDNLHKSCVVKYLGNVLGDKADSPKTDLKTVCKEYLRNLKLKLQISKFHYEKRALKMKKTRCYDYVCFRGKRFKSGLFDEVIDDEGDDLRNKIKLFTEPYSLLEDDELQPAMRRMKSLAKKKEVHKHKSYT